MFMGRDEVTLISDERARAAMAGYHELVGSPRREIYQES